MKTPTRTRGDLLRRSCLALAIVTFTCSIALAHAFSPGLLDIRQQTSGAFVAYWTPPRGIVEAVSEALAPAPVFPPGCTVQYLAGDESGALTLLLQCGAGGLSGATLSVRNLAATRSDALVRVHWLGGQEFSGVVHGGAPSLDLPTNAAQGSTWEMAIHYVQLGIHHIGTGWDHLMFLLLLVMLTQARHSGDLRATSRAVIWTATAFTIAHSITLSLAAFGAVQLPPQPVEALIALSICFLGAALLVGDAMPMHQTHAAFGFGLLHGLGFAGALRESGLPAAHLPLALLTFNIGVEIGQLVFVSAALGGLTVAQRLGVPLRRLQVGAAYAMGTLAAAVTIERVALFWR